MIFLKAGILTSIQDLGRYGNQELGVNPSGVMDTLSMRLINILLDNPENEAVLEMHYPAPTLTFEEHAIFAIGGAEFSAALNGKPIDNWKIFTATPGDMLSFGKKTEGERAYLSVKGGFQVPEVLGSKSTNLKAGFGGKKIEKGDHVGLNLKNGMLYQAAKKLAVSPKRVNLKLRPAAFHDIHEVRIISGLDMESLDKDSRDKVFNQRFIISSRSDRMGYRLEGDTLNVGAAQEVISSSVAFGTIQLLPDGQIIILMADHQTTGGYPKIGQVITVDLPLLAQLSVGQHISFREVSVEEAEEIFLKQEREIQKFKTSVHLYS